MKINSKMSILAVGALLLTTACVDDNYDLTDIDTTTRVNVNNLVVPINIDNIQLKSIIDVNEDDPNAKIQIVDGAYAYVQSGDFTSSEVSVKGVTINSAKASQLDLRLPINLPPVTGVLPQPVTVALHIPAESTDYSFSAKDITDDICGLNVVNGRCEVKMSVEVTGLENVKTTYEFVDLRLKVPAGMTLSECTGCTFDQASHCIVINTTTTNPVINVGCTATSLALAPGEFDEATHSINVAGEVGITKGDLNVSVSEIKGGVSELGLKVRYTFSQMQVETVDGVLKYSIGNVNVPEINITDLPDVLAQPGTNLLLSNPQLYLSVNNPLYQVGAYAQTGFEITAYHGSASAKYAIDNPYFTIAANETDKYCFSPRMPSSVDAAYRGCEHVPFADLSRVLSGDGLPDKLKVELTDPCIPRQHIANFMLGHNYGKIHGTYKFVAPLQFDGGSCIVYNDKLDDWSSDDLDKLTVTRLEVNFAVTTDIPVGIDFTGYPLDKHGNRMQGVTISGASIEANAQGQEVKITITGEIRNLDGLEFEAKASPEAGGAALNPGMTIKLANIRPCVSGYYQTEL